MLRWYDLRSPHGTITIKADNVAAAKAEAADRWRCGEDEIVCVGHKPFNTFLAARRAWL